MKKNEKKTSDQDVELNLEKVGDMIVGGQLKKSDTVVVITGKDKGTSGKVLTLGPSQNAVIVEGVNMVTKHIRPQQDNGKGGIVPKEAPIDASFQRT